MSKRYMSKPLSKIKETKNEHDEGITKACEESFIDGIRKGLEDFAKGNYVVFEDDDELEAHMMNVESEIRFAREAGESFRQVTLNTRF